MNADRGASPASPPKPFPRWPIVLLAAGAFVAVWSGWVGLGELAGFGVIHPLPGIWDAATINTAITLPIGLESYAAFALGAWLSGRAPERARTFAMCSAIGSLVLGACGQVAYHLLVAGGATVAPPAVVVAVACIPVAVLGMGATLSHLMSQRDRDSVATAPVVAEPVSRDTVATVRRDATRDIERATTAVRRDSATRQALRQDWSDGMTRLATLALSHGVSKRQAERWTKDLRDSVAVAADAAGDAT